ncbi:MULTISPECIES: META domain-containing protein [unclassified Streptomyces]|uniref:META domain-containing protein n=2 Tax=Streptomyces TaxID=1883 RepID=UPI0033B408F0
MQWIKVDGRVTAAPPRFAAWAEFGYDNTTRGNYGCTSFKAATTITRYTLAIERKTDEAPPARYCPKAHRSFEEKLRKLFDGPLAINRRVDDLTMDLKNQQGDYIAVKLIWPKGLFGSRWRLDHLIVGDSVAPIVGGEEVYYVFHQDGTVNGRAGCNDFTGRAVFDNDALLMYRLTRTTHRTCSQELMEQEKHLLTDETTDEDRPRRMEYGYSLTNAFEAIDLSGGLNRFGYHWVRMSDG